MTTAGDRSRAEQVGDSAALAALARVGLVAYGLVHLLICWLALQLAWGAAAGKNADPSGALRTLAAQPWGEVLLWLVAGGLVALALWQGGEAIWGHRHREGVDRLRVQVTGGGKAVVYALLGFNAAAVALGSRSSSSRSQQEATAGVLAWPGGQMFVTAAGLVVIGVGVYLVVKGVRTAFLDDVDTSSLSPGARHLLARVGQIGHVAKGASLGLVGGILSWAALTFDPEMARGLDGALHTLLRQPFGSYLLTAIAAGFLAFGAFTILQSRYRRM